MTAARRRLLAAWAELGRALVAALGVPHLTDMPLDPRGRRARKASPSDLDRERARQALRRTGRL